MPIASAELRAEQIEETVNDARKLANQAVLGAKDLWGESDSRTQRIWQAWRGLDRAVIECRLHRLCDVGVTSTPS